MGHLNNVTGYHEDLLANHAIVKHSNFVLLIPDGLVKNITPGFESCNAIVLSTPKLDASSVDYLVTLHQDDDSQQGFGDEGIETFLCVISGDITAKAEGKAFVSSEGGHLYCPSGPLMTFVNAQAEDDQIFLHKCYYISIEGHVPRLVSGNASELERIHYEGMDGVILLDFPPKELGFGMNIYTLSFAPGVSHGYIETHTQGHSACVLSGQGVYNLDNNWIPVKKGDYIFMGVCSLQAGYGVGRGEAFSHIYLKDCNRDVEIQAVPLV